MISDKIKAELEIKEYRDAFVSEHINTGIPFQIKALRKQRGWTQEELAERVGMKQERISALENPNYSKFTIATLKKIASAFDVALIVRFAPLSELVQWELNLSQEKLEALSFNEDPYFKETTQKEYNIAHLQPEPPIFYYVDSDRLCLLGEAGYQYPYLETQKSVTANVTNISYARQKAVAEKMVETQKEIELPMQKLLAGGGRL